jgi:putative addiction module component (TIGR02574 family)
MLRDDLKNLSTKEKIDLVQELWDSIEEDTLTTLTPKQKKVLKQREKSAMGPHAKFLTWEEIIATIRKKTK